jgi:hypothetical protein
MVASIDHYKTLHKNLLGMVVAFSAIAALGLTFHYYGHSSYVPGPSSQFGFWALAPIGIIDRIYIAFTGMRLYWDPIPMFLVLWSFYMGISGLMAYKFLLPKSQ